MASYDIQCLRVFVLVPDDENDQMAETSFMDGKADIASTATADYNVGVGPQARGIVHYSEPTQSRLMLHRIFPK